MYGQLTVVALAFILLTILTVMIDRWTLWTQGIVKAIPFLPDEYHWTVGYAMVFGVAMVACWRLQFNLFASLDHPGITVWDGYVFTSLMMSGGSSFLASQYKAIDGIPGILRGVVSTFTSMVSSSAGQTNLQESASEIATEPVDDSGEGDKIK